MMAAAMQLVFCLSVLVTITGAADIFKLVNTSVQLDVQRKSEDFDLFWRFNINNNIVKHTTAKTTVYNSEDKMEFNNKTYSLALKNIQKNDSGLYEAVESDKRTEIVAAYQLHVLDPVENPVLTASHQQNNDTCNVTFICEAQELSITSHCYSDNCNKEEKKIPGENHSSLSMYFTNRLIICNYSNPVSWKYRSMEMEETFRKYCLSKGSKTDPAGSGIPNGTVIIIIIIVIITVVAVVLVLSWFKKHRKNRGTDNTVYEEVQGGNKAQSAEMSVIPETPGTLYCTVGMAAQACSIDENTVSTANSGNQEMDNKNKQSNVYDTPDTLPQTIYATVNKVGKGA